MPALGSKGGKDEVEEIGQSAQRRVVFLPFLQLIVYVNMFKWINGLLHLVINR